MNKNNQLLKNIKDNLLELEELMKKVNLKGSYEDFIYRFYHQSFKVYGVQSITEEIVVKLKEIAPEGVTFNLWFEEIFKEGTGKIFERSHNKEWLKQTRSMVEAFFHAKYFLEMAVKYGKELDTVPDCLPFGWAALLYFYNMR